MVIVYLILMTQNYSKVIHVAPVQGEAGLFVPFTNMAIQSTLHDTYTKH